MVSSSERNFYLRDLCNHLGICFETQIQTLRLYLLLSATFSYKREFTIYSNEPNLYIYLSESRDTPFGISEDEFLMRLDQHNFPSPLLSSLLAFSSPTVLLQTLSYFVYGFTTPWLSCFTLVKVPCLVYIYFQCS